MLLNKHYVILATTILMLFSYCSISYSQTSNEWSALAITDLQDIHTLITENHPGAIGYTTPTFQNWFNPGYNQAISRAKSVSSYAAYVSVLYFYVNGFHDGHLSIHILKKPDSNLSPKIIKLNLRTRPQFVIQSFSQNSIWISIPSFQGLIENNNNNAQQIAHNLYNIINQIPNFRHKNIVVFDVRGNRGGDADFSRALIRNFYTDAYLESLGKQFIWNQPWIESYRVSQDNLPMFEKHNHDIAAKMLVALQSGKPFVQSSFNILPTNTLSSKQTLANPVTARVFLLTDRHCGSDCWLFTRELTQIPGVTQVGSPTTAMTPYTNPQPHLLKSDDAILYVASSVFIQPLDHFNEPFIPKYIYSGDLNNTQNVMQWIEKIADANNIS
jgi:hypothetical protein